MTLKLSEASSCQTEPIEVVWCNLIRIVDGDVWTTFFLAKYLRLALGSRLRMAVHWWFPKWPSILKPSYPFLSPIESLIPFIEFDAGFIFCCPCLLVKSCLPRILGKPFFGSWHSAKWKTSFVAFLSQCLIIVNPSNPSVSGFFPSLL